MFAGDIFSCQKNLSVLLKQKPSVDEKTIDELGKMIVKFSEDSFIPVEYSEKILTSTGNLMERCSQHGTLERFAASATFTNALVSIICDFGTRISVDSGNISPSSFSSHYCYELSLFMLLGLLDKSPILRIFVRVTDEAVVTKLMKSLCVTITKDYAYLTQEVGLEVVSRLSHFYLQQDRDAFERVSVEVSPIIKDVISDPVRIPQLLRDMRPLLNSINESNPNVFSIAVTMFRIGTSWKKIDTVRDVHDNGWLDLCKNDICYNLLEEEVLIRFDYQAIKKVHFSIETNSVQILLYTCPKKLRELLKKEEIPPPSHCPVLMFEFSGSAKVVEDVKSIMEMRMIEHETVKLDGKKYSVVSSRQQSPEAAAQAAERLQKLQLEQEGKGENVTKPGALVANGQANFVSPKSGSTLKQGRTSSSKKTSSNAKKKPKPGESVEETPSSISSPDMEVPSVDSSQLDLPDHKQGPDTLVHLYDQKTTPAPAKPTAADRTTKTKAGSRKIGAGAGEDILARLEPPSKRSTTTGRKQAVPFEHTEVEISFPTTKQGTGTKKATAKAQKTSSKKSERPLRKSIAKPPPHVDVPVADDAYAGDYDDGFGDYNFTSPVVSPIPEPTKVATTTGGRKFGTKSGRAPLHPLTESATNICNAAAVPTTGTSTLTTPKSVLPTGARMRASTTRAIATTGTLGPVDKVTPAQEEGDKENIDVPWLQDSPSVSQAGTHGSKRKFGRATPIKPIEAPKVDWTAMEEPPASNEKERQRNQRIEDAARAKEKAAEKRRQRTVSESVQKGKKTDDHPPPLPLTKASAVKGRSSDSVTGSLLPTSTTPKMTVPRRRPQKDAPVVPSAHPPRHTEVPTPPKPREEDKNLAERWDDTYQDGGDADISYDHGFAKNQDFPVEPAQPSVSEIQPISNIAAAPEVVYSWRQQPVPQPVEDSHRPLSHLAAKLQASRAELAHEVATESAAAELTAVKAAQEEAPISIPTFTQALAAGRPVSQVSHASRTSGSQYAPSVYFSSAEEHDAPRGLDVDDPFSRHRGRASKPAAARSSTRGRKRKAEEVYSDEESENESIDVEEERSGSTPSSSSGDNGIVAALLREIVMMQKERAKRKRARMLSNVGQAARAQVVGFLDQWRSFTEHSAAELKRSANMQLENLCTSADTLCEALGKDVELYTQRDQEQTRDLQGLERDVTALKTELNTAVSQCRAEEAALRTEIMGLKNRALDTAKKTMSMHKDSRHNTSKQQNKELLDALKQM